MRNVNIHIVNIFCMICLHNHANGSVWNSHSSEFYLSTWLKYDSICAQVISSWRQIYKMSLLQKLKMNTHFKYLSSIWLII